MFMVVSAVAALVLMVNIKDEIDSPLTFPILILALPALLAGAVAFGLLFMTIYMTYLLIQLTIIFAKSLHLKLRLVCLRVRKGV